MDAEKKRAPWVPALIEPPDPLAPLEEWQSYRAGLDALDARLLVSHPDLDWLDGMRAFKAQADAVIARYRAAERKPPLIGSLAVLAMVTRVGAYKSFY